MKCESIADEYGEAAMELFSLAARLEYLGRSPGAVSLDSDGLLALRDVSGKLRSLEAQQRKQMEKDRTVL